MLDHLRGRDKRSDRDRTSRDEPAADLSLGSDPLPGPPRLRVILKFDVNDRTQLGRDLRAIDEREHFRWPRCLRTGIDIGAQPVLWKLGDQPLTHPPFRTLPRRVLAS